MHTINDNAVRGRSYENFLTRKFIIRNFLYTKISRSTVYSLPLLLFDRSLVVPIQRLFWGRWDRSLVWDYNVINCALQKVQLHILDLSQPRKVVEFANSFVASEQGVDVLVNNAGVMVNQRELTEEGLEKNFCTNTLGKAPSNLKANMIMV